MLERLIQWCGRGLATYLSQRTRRPVASAISDPALLAAALRPADVVLVEGDRRISTAIKYLTQSTWSHAALFVGDVLGARNRQGDPLVCVEADLVQGVRAVALSELAAVRTRICRPVGLTATDRERVVDYVVARLGDQYDLKNVIDLVRYLFPTPPVPSEWRRSMLTLGSGDPTLAICSTLITQAFQTVRYPILPETAAADAREEAPGATAWKRRHFSLFVPRDFDISPYFQIVKPELEAHFDYRGLRWDDDTAVAGRPVPLHQAHGISRPASQRCASVTFQPFGARP